MKEKNKRNKILAWVLCMIMIVSQSTFIFAGETVAAPEVLQEVSAEPTVTEAPVAPVVEEVPVVTQESTAEPMPTTTEAPTAEPTVQVATPEPTAEASALEPTPESESGAVTDSAQGAATEATVGNEESTELAGAITDPAQGAANTAEYTEAAAEGTQESEENTSEGEVQTIALEDAENTEEMDTDEVLTLTTVLKGTVITMSGPKSSFPEGTDYSVSATELTEEAIVDVETTLRKVELQKDTKITSYKAYDIKLLVDGVEVQPVGNVNVTFQGGEIEAQIADAQQVEILHVDENAQVAVNVEGTVENNEVEMTTNHFSTYVITTTNTEGVDITVQHYLTEGKTELYRESIEHLKVTEKIEDISVAANYTVDKVVKIEGNTETEITGEQVITANTTYRVYYTPTTGRTTGDVQVFDYQVNPQNGNSINHESNYAQASTTSTRMASGKLEHNKQETKYNAYKTQSNTRYKINDFDDGPALTGLVTGVNYETGELVMGNGDSGKLYEPGFFTNATKSGKQIYADDYTLEFARTGDTYVFTNVLKGGSVKATAGADFFPLDDIQNNYPDQANSGNRNFFFGLRYDIEFSIGDYNGSLNYEFTGDDDLWVVLDAKDNGGRVVIDLGGIHRAKTGSVDIWQALGVTPETITDEQRAQTHTLTILYMERGAGESNCQMKFTLPNSKVINATQNPIDYSFIKVNSTESGIAGATFGLYDTSGTLLKTATSATDGTVTFANLYDGTYVVKETKAASGYVKVDTEWTLTVKDGMATMTVTGSDEAVTKVVNYTEKEEATRNLTNGKTVSVVDENNRTFKINLTAATTGETQGTAAKAASIVLVLDASSSMTTDNAFGSLKNAVAGTNTQEGFIDKIASVSPASKIGIVWYNGDERESSSQTSAKSFMTLDSTTNISALKTFVNNKRASSGTPMGDGLKAAYEMLKADTSGNEKYVIFFTDGLPGHSNQNDNFNCMVANNAFNYASKIKDTNDGNSVLYTVGYNLGSSSFKWVQGHSATSENNHGTHGSDTSMTGTSFLSSKIATSSQHAYTANNIDDLQATFDSLAGKLGELFKLQAKSIVDVIDARFELTAESEDALKKQYGNNVSIVKNTDGTTTITWTGETAMIQNAADGGWAAEFVVQAKSDFVGGNMIPTNGADSGINLESDQSKPFPQPSVNVKLLAPSLSGQEITVYKGDTVDSSTFAEVLADTLKVTKLYSEADEKISVIPELTVEQLAVLHAGTAVEIPYSYSDTAAANDYVGKFKFEYVIPKDITPGTEHVESVSGKPAETYTLKVTYIPDTVDERKAELSGITQPAANGGTVVTSKEATADYIVNVISGEIQITKTLEKVADVDKTFTFTVTSGDAFSKEVTVTIPAGQISASYTGTDLEDLDRGTYVVTENDVEGYVVQNMVIGSNTDCENSAADEVATFVLGNSISKENVIKEYTYNPTDGGVLGVAEYTNEEAIKDWRIIKRSTSSTTENPVYLGGAEFELRVAGGDTTATWYKGVSSADDASKGIITWYPNGENTALASGEYIEKGEYILKEVKAPAGYSLSNVTWTIVIASKGSLKSITDANGNAVGFDSTNNIVTFYYDNEPLYDLPSAGSSGIYWYMIGGVLLMFAATLILYKNRRKEVLARYKY